MKCYGVVGWKNSGKTNLIERLVQHLTREGMRVSTIKHAHHNFDIDQPGRDSFRHRAAGASEVLLISEHRWALMHENQSPAPPRLDAMIARLSPSDLVLIEGFKNEPHPKIEASLAPAPKPLIARGDKTITALAINYPLKSQRPIFSIDDTGAIVAHIKNELKL